MDHKNRCIHTLPHGAKVKRLKLLIESSGASVLAIGRIVPQGLPVRMLAENCSWIHAIVEIKVVKLGIRLHRAPNLAWRLFLAREAAALEFKHVLVPSAPPRTS